MRSTAIVAAALVILAGLSGCAGYTVKATVGYTDPKGWAVNTGWEWEKNADPKAVKPLVHESGYSK